MSPIRLPLVATANPACRNDQAWSGGSGQGITSLKTACRLSDRAQRPDCCVTATLVLATSLLGEDDSTDEKTVRVHLLYHRPWFKSPIRCRELRPDII